MRSYYRFRYQGGTDGVWVGEENQTEYQGRAEERSEHWSWWGGGLSEEGGSGTAVDRMHVPNDWPGGRSPGGTFTFMAKGKLIHSEGLTS